MTFQRWSTRIVERFHRTLLDEHFRVEGRKTWIETIQGMQVVLDDYLVGYIERRPLQGRGMKGHRHKPAADHQATCTFCMRELMVSANNFLLRRNLIAAFAP